MRKAYRILAWAISVEVVIQAMAIAFALAGLGKWIDDGHTLNKKIADDHPSFTGSVGFPVHAINGEMLIPLLAIILLIVSLRARIPGGTRWAGYILGLIVVQVILGITAGDVPYLILLHAFNAFLIFSTAFLAGRRTLENQPTAQGTTAAAI